MTRLSKLQQQILKQRGLQRSSEDARYGTTTRRRRKLINSTCLPSDFPKTPLMLLTEQHFRKPIEELLLEGNGQQVAKKLKVDKATISRWKQLVLRAYDEEHLPSCDSCAMASLHCIIEGQCVILATLWPHLLGAKRKEITHGQ